MKNEILIIGGTGNVGTPLVKLLRDSDASFRALARSDESVEKLRAQGVATVRAALGEWPNVEAALAGVDTVFLLSNAGPEMLELHKELIDRAAAAGVRKIVRMSAEPARYGVEMALYSQHSKADEYLEQSGLNYVILRPHYFMQNIPAMHADSMKVKSMFTQYLGDARIPMVDTGNIARAAYTCLTSDDFNNQTYYITGPRSISFNDVAEAYSKSLGHDIQYVSLSYEDQKSVLEAYGVPEWTLKSVMTLFKHWVDEGEQEVSPDFERITGAKATDINSFAAEFAAS